MLDSFFGIGAALKLRSVGNGFCNNRTFGYCVNSLGYTFFQKDNKTDSLFCAFGKSVTHKVASVDEETNPSSHNLYFEL